MTVRRQALFLFSVLLPSVLPSGAHAERPRSLDPRLEFVQIAAEPAIVTPTGIAVDHRGRVLVIESHTHFRPKNYEGPPADRIRIFEDRDGDGKLECTGSLLEGTEKTMNLAVARDGFIWVATRSAIYRLADRDGDGRADGVAPGSLPAPIVRLDTKGDYPHNGLSGFAFDRTGSVYFGLGENLGADYRLIGPQGPALSGGGEGGSIYRLWPDGSLERFATGFWNPFHLTWTRDGTLFAVDNDPDSRPPCRLLHIVEAGDYGYRFRNGRRGTHPFTAWNGELPGTLGMVAGTGEAPCGVIEYQGDQLPPDYRGTLLVTSWGDHRIEQFRLEPHGASYRSSLKPVVSGGDDFRPVGIAMAPDGSLYVSDWVDKSYDLHGKGRIWRLQSRARPARPSSADRGATANHVVDPPASTASTELGPQAVATAYEQTSEQLKATAASDRSPARRAEAMRHLRDPTARALLLSALESDDPFLQQAARQGLRQSLERAALLSLAANPKLSPRERLGVLLIVRDWETPEARGLVTAYLSDPDPLIRFAAIQWVGEQRLAEYRPQLQNALISPATTRTLFEATLAALERLDNTSRNPKEEIAGEEYIAALLKDPNSSAAIRERGLRMLRPDHPVLTLDRLRRFITYSGEPAVAIEAVRSLSRSPLPDRIGVLSALAADPKAPIPLRAEAIVGLSDQAADKRDVLLNLANSDQLILRHEALRTLRGVPLDEAAFHRLRAACSSDETALELLEKLEQNGAKPPAHPAPNDLDGWLARLEGPADRAAGERVFFHPKGPGCYQCHQVSGRGGRTGPDLSSVAGGMDRRRLVESIVAPSKEIAPQFVAWTVATTDGKVFTGILLEQTPYGTFVFADTRGQPIELKSESIAERKQATVSIMPDNMAQTMTRQEFRDLLAFLLGR